MNEEVWIDVVGFEDYFQVSNMGNVFSKRTNKILKQYSYSQGRKAIATKIGGRLGKNVRFLVHRLVADAFIPNPDGKPEVNHKDCNPANNVWTNLEWTTKEENLKHWLDSEKFKLFDFSCPEKRIIDYENLLQDFEMSGMSIRKYAKAKGCSYSGMQHALRFLKTGSRYK